MAAQPVTTWYPDPGDTVEVWKEDPQVEQEISRRSFLMEVAGAALAAPAAVATLGAVDSKAAASEAGDAYWLQVRRQFSFGDDRVPMNAANLCPSPRVVSARVTELTRDIDRDCSFNNRAKFRMLLEESRRRVAEQLGVTADEIALVRNTSEANNVINNGLDLAAGDEVVFWEQNHPTNNVAWKVRAARFGLSLKSVSCSPHPADTGELVEAFEAAMGARTRILALTHVSNTSGLRLPIREICEVARRRGIHVHVDGAQTWGALDVDLVELGCDSYSASAHKWLAGPKEVGVLYVKAEAIPRIWPNVVAPGWGDDVEPDTQGARKFESLGQRDDAALAAVATAAEFHRGIGAAHIESRVFELATFLKTALRDMGFKLVTPLAPELSAGVVIVQVPQEKRRLIFDRLYNEYGIAGSTSGGLRLCPHIYNTRRHVERALEALEAMRDLIG